MSANQGPSRRARTFRRRRGVRRDIYGSIAANLLVMNMNMDDDNGGENSDDSAMDVERENYDNELFTTENSQIFENDEAETASSHQQSATTAAVAGTSSTTARATAANNHELATAVEETRNENENESPKKRKLNKNCSENAEREQCVEKEDTLNGSLLDGLDDSKTCAICFSDYTTDGVHRLSSLKCGHLFGYSCIKKWLNQKNFSKNTCPNCKTKINLKRDVHKIFARGVKMIDTNELESTKSQLDEAKKRNEHLEIELSTVRALFNKQKTENEQLVAEIQMTVQCTSKAFDENLPSTSGQNMGTKSPLKLEFRHEIQICGGESVDFDACRTLAYSNSAYFNGLVVGCQLPLNNLWKGYGLRKVDLLEDGSVLRAQDYINCHQKRLRDVKFSPSRDGLLLSCSEDCTMRLSSVHTKSLVKGFNLDRPVWSCCWQRQENSLFAATNNGKVFMFDTRMENSSVEELASSGSIPITNLQWMSLGNGIEGLFVGRLNGAVFYEAVGPTAFTQHILFDAQSSISSFAIDTATNHVLITCRPCRGQPVVHKLYSVESVSLTNPSQRCLVRASLINSYTDGVIQTKLGKNALFCHANKLFGVVYTESESQLSLISADCAKYDSQLNEVKSASLDSCRIAGGGVKAVELLFDQRQNYPNLAVLAQNRLLLYEIS